MNESKLKSLIAEAVLLDREIADRSERLREAKKLLVAEALNRAPEHIPTSGGGVSWTAQGADGCIARVSFPAPALKAGIDADSRALEKVRLLAGRFFDRLFLATPKFRPVENFRDEAERHLGPSMARRLIGLCQSESSPRVSFETRESMEAAR